MFRKKARNTASTTSTVGRPRDPSIEQRVLQAAREELADKGVSGFSMRKVAARSGTPRPSILLRWPDCESLIIEAVDDIAELPPLADTGTLRGDLTALAEDLDALLRPPMLDLQHKLASEATKHPGLYLRFQKNVMRPGALRARSAFSRAINRGELPTSTNLQWLVDAFIGGLLIRTISSPGLVPPPAKDRIGLIDLLLKGAGHAENDRTKPTQKKRGRKSTTPATTLRFGKERFSSKNQSVQKRSYSV